MIRQCPRCGGNLALASRTNELFCIQCGYYDYQPTAERIKSRGIRRHHNNKGLRQIRRGKTADQVQAIAQRITQDRFKGLHHPGAFTRFVSYLDLKER